MSTISHNYLHWDDPIQAEAKRIELDRLGRRRSLSVEGTHKASAWSTRATA